jgi:hypothetical protein
MTSLSVSLGASPVVTVNVTLARTNIRIVRTMVGGFADRVLRAAGLSAENVTALNGQRALELLRSRPAELPKAVIAAAIVEAFAKLAAMCNLVLNVATMAERNDSQSLSFKVLDMSNKILGVTGQISTILERFENPTAGLFGLGAIEASDWLRYAGFLGLLSAGASGGAGVVAGFALILFAEIVDKIDGIGSNAAELAQAACDEQARLTGRPCTAAEYQAFYADERERERRDSLSNKVLEAAENIAAKTTGAFTDALFWLVLLGGVGAALYFAGPALAERGVQTARRLRA